MWFCCGVLMAIIVLEGVLRMMPVSTGLHRTADYARWPLQNADPWTPYSYSLTWAMLNAHHGKTNNYGHVAPFDYRRDSRPVVVIGDSFIESLMNEYADTLQSQLSRMLHAPDAVYGLGVSGLSASDYVALSKQAKDEFHPTAAVVVLIDGDLSESLIPEYGSHFLVHKDGHLALRYDPVHGDSLGTRVRKVIGDISVHRYFQVNLQFSLDKLVAAFRAAPPAISAPDLHGLQDQVEVADWFLGQLPGSLGVSAKCIALVLDSDRYAIYRPDMASKPKDSPKARQYLIDHARALGFKVTDLDGIFRRAYAKDHAKFDHWPIDRHWNRLGHGIAAEAAYQDLFAPVPGQANACMPGEKDKTPSEPLAGKVAAASAALRPVRTSPIR